MHERDEQKISDARGLAPDALERLRRQAVAAVESGTPQMQVASRFGVSRKSVGEWVRAHRERGEESFRPARRGRRPGQQLALCTALQDRILRIVVADPPDGIGLPYLLWTRRAVSELIHREFGITLSTATVGRYLLRWGVDTAVEPTGTAYPGRPLAGYADPSLAEVVSLSWARPRLASSDGHPAYALLAVTTTGALHFLARDRPLAAEVLDDLRDRLRLQLARDVRLVVRSWPPEHVELLSSWMSRNRT
jgi:transposase